jgi:predicted nucleic acid-binding Zn ribbon protein
MSQGNQSTKRCPFCGEEILSNAVKCKYCGEWLTKRCPSCAKEIPADAIKCRYCGEWLNKPQQPVVQRFSNAQPVWRFVLLTIATLGIYQVYWFYRNWKHFKIHKNLNISPGWRTVGLFVPILGALLAYRQFRDIADFAKEAGVDKTYSPELVFFSWLILQCLCLLLPDQLMFLCFLTIWPLAVVQRVLNAYWEKEQPGLPVRTNFSGGEIALLIIGGTLLILTLIGSFAEL